MRRSTRRTAPARPTGALALALALMLPAMAGCSGDDSGPLTLAGYGNVLDGQDRPPYFTIHMCIDEDDPADITITEVSASGVEGTRRPLTFRVAWADGPEFTRVISARQPLPSAYVDAVDAEGTVGECGSPEGNASLAVVFPTVGRRPVALTGIEVRYDIDGDSYTASTDAFLAQCPVGTRAGTGNLIGEDPLCRKDNRGDGGDRAAR